MFKLTHFLNWPNFRPNNLTQALILLRMLHTNKISGIKGLCAISCLNFTSSFKAWDFLFYFSTEIIIIPRNIIIWKLHFLFCQICTEMTLTKAPGLNEITLLPCAHREEPWFRMLSKDLFEISKAPQVEAIFISTNSSETRRSKCF